MTIRLGMRVLDTLRCPRDPWKKPGWRVWRLLVMYCSVGARGFLGLPLLS